MRKPMIAGNWKMNGTRQLVAAYRKAFTDTDITDKVDVLLIPSFPYIGELVRALLGSGVKVGAQTLNPRGAGAHTGEVSGVMLHELGAEYVLIGHSERRRLYKESEDEIFARVNAAVSEQLHPILCVGETLEQHKSGNALSTVLHQVSSVMERLDARYLPWVSIAYEPVWAIGTGLTATPEQAQEVHAAIRGYLHEIDPEVAETTRLLYGGSMNAHNARRLLAQPDIDGGLIGGSSLRTEDFLSICHVAGQN